MCTYCIVLFVCKCVLYSTVLFVCKCVLYCTLLFVCKCVLYCTVLYCTVLFVCKYVLYCTVLFVCKCVLYCTLLYCNVLYCTVLLQQGVNPIAVNVYIIYLYIEMGRKLASVLFSFMDKFSIAQGEGKYRGLLPLKVKRSNMASKM